MLSKIENKVMTAICYQSKGKHSVLLSPIDIVESAGLKVKDASRVDKIVSDLSCDGYFDLVLSSRHGEKVFCIALTDKGKGFLRSEKMVRRNLMFRFMLSVGFAVLSFIIGLILKAIF